MGLEQMYFVKHLANGTCPFVIYILHFLSFFPKNPMFIKAPASPASQQKRRVSYSDSSNLVSRGRIVLSLVITTEMDIVRIPARTHFVTEMARPALGLNMFGFHVVFHVLARTTEVFASTALEARLSSLTNLAV